MASRIFRGIRVLVCSICLIIISLCTCNFLAAESYMMSKGQTVYVPVYSNIFTSPKKVPIDLSNILSIRNTDTTHSIRVTDADYFNTKGVLVKKYYTEPVTLSPLETMYIFLSNKDKEGGLGASFVIKWEADREVNAPIIECVMAGSEGRTFLSSGRAIKTTGQ